MLARVNKADFGKLKLAVASIGQIDGGIIFAIGHVEEKLQRFLLVMHELVHIQQVA